LNARPRNDPTVLATVGVLWLGVGLFVLYPLAMLLLRAFLAEGQLSQGPLFAMLGERIHRQSLLNSLILATLVGGIGTALGFVFALAATRCELSAPARGALDALAFLPLISPPFTTSIAIIFSFGPRGLITHDLLGLTGTSAYGLPTTLLSEVLTYFPLAYLTLKPVLAGIDPNLEDMAASLRAGGWRIFRTVTLPLCIPGFANAFLLLFAASLADFATPLILAGSNFPVLPTQAYLQITGLFDFKGGAVLSFVLLVPAMVVYLLQRWWVARGHYVTVTGKVGPRALSRPLPTAARIPLLAVCSALAVVIAYFYALLFYASVVKAFGADHSFTLAHYRVIFTEGLKAIRDTLIIAGIGMPLGGLFGVVVGYLVTRKRFPGRHALEMTVMLNYALPGTIVGIGYLIAFNDPPIVLTGTAAIIVACYVFRYAPTGVRATIAQLQQIDPSLEEASTGMGAGSFETFRRVTLPLVLPAFFAGLGVMFVRSLTAISATIFLISIGWTLITVRILENMTELALGPAAAFSVLVVAMVFAVTGLIALLLRRLRAPGTMALAGSMGG